MTAQLVRANEAQAETIGNRASAIIKFLRESDMTPSEGFEALIVAIRMLHCHAPMRFREGAEELLRRMMIDIYQQPPCDKHEHGQ